MTVLHVDPPMEIAAGTTEPVMLAPDVLQRMMEERSREIEHELSGIRSHLEPFEVDTLVRRGAPVAEIVAAAVDLQADMIVIGSHGRGASRFLFGSVAEKVSRRAGCPVLISRGQAPVRVPFQSVLVASDFSVFTEPCVRLASRLTDPAGRLEVMHVIEDTHSPLFLTGAEGADELVRAARESRVRRLEALQSQIDRLHLRASATTYVEAGNPPSEILARASQLNADLIVVGAHGQQGVRERILGTVADRVLRHAEVPVLLVPHAP